MVYKICKQMITLKAYEDAKAYQERLDTLFALEGLTTEQYKELSDLLKSNM